MSERSEAPPRLGRLRLALIGLGAAVLLTAAGGRSHGAEVGVAATAGPSLAPVGIVVRERTPASPAAEGLVRRLGGRVTRKLPIVDGFAADVPKRALPRLERSPSVVALWRDGRLRMRDLDDDDEEDDDEDDDDDEVSEYGSPP